MESKLKQGSFFIAFVCGHKRKYNLPFTMYNWAMQMKAETGNDLQKAQMINGKCINENL